MAHRSLAIDLLIRVAKLITLIILWFGVYLLIHKYSPTPLYRENLLVFYWLFIIGCVGFYIVNLFRFAHTHIEF